LYAHFGNIQRESFKGGVQRVESI